MEQCQSWFPAISCPAAARQGYSPHGISPTSLHLFFPCRNEKQVYAI